MDLWKVIIVVNVVYLFLYPFLSPYLSSSTRGENRLARVERKLDAIMKHLGIEDDLTVQVPASVEELMQTGQKIAAIKALRESNPGLGLKEAKDVIEERMRQGLIRPRI